MNRLLKFVTIVCVCAAVYFGVQVVAQMIYPMEYKTIVSRNSVEFQVEEQLIYAVIKAESNFDKNAVSPKEAKGLMQILEPTGQWIAQQLGSDNLAAAELTEPEANICMGTYYLSYLLNRYNGDKTCAIAAYNAGQANVDSWLLSKQYSKDGKTLQNIPFSETEKYVKEVLKNEKIYHYLYGDV